MTVFNHMNEEHLYDDNHVNFVRRTHTDMVELNSFNDSIDYEFEYINQGRDQKHQERLLANVYYTFLTAGTLLMAYGIYKLYEILLNSI